MSDHFQDIIDGVRKAATPAGEAAHPLTIAIGELNEYGIDSSAMGSATEADVMEILEHLLEDSPKVPEETQTAVNHMMLYGIAGFELYTRNGEVFSKMVVPSPQEQTNGNRKA